MENNEAAFTPLAEEAFLSLGSEQIAYVKAINLPDADPPARTGTCAGSLKSDGARAASGSALRLD